MLKMPDPTSIERRNRIRLAVAAYAYEVMDNPVMSDAHFDRLSRSINPAMVTGNAEMDLFFATNFNPSTGQWVHKHPHPAQLQFIIAVVGERMREKFT